MMMFYRLVRLIEAWLQAFSSVCKSRKTPGYKNVPPEELKERAFMKSTGTWETG